MALSGNFHNYPVGEFGLYCTWSGVQNYSGNYTDVTLNVYLRYYTINTVTRPNSTISINGETETYTANGIVDYNSTSWHNVLLKSKTVRVKHNADGTKNNVPLSASWYFGGTYSGVRVDTITVSANINLDSIPVYSLSISAGEGSSIIVNRTSSGYGNTGNLSNAAKLYKNDTLKISFVPNANYAIATHTVNNTTFTSGSTHNVSGNVSVKSTAQILASGVSASNANVGEISTITITKHEPNHCHSLQYEFGSITGYITNSGDVSNYETKFSETSIPFKIPNTFYAEMPNSKAGVCTIRCKTYANTNSTTVLGEAVICTFTVTAKSTPTISGTVIDINETTVALTGDSSKLIRYKSVAEATITAVASNSATIAAKYINGAVVANDKKTFSGVSATEFTFKATDSRGYSDSKTITPVMIAYIQLTLNAEIRRPSPTEGTIELAFNGNYYQGSFGAYSNTLAVSYRYKELSSNVYSEWVTVPSSSYVVGTGGYSTPTPISIGEDFDYQNSYVFQVRAIDGTPEYPLSVITKTFTMRQGLPVFDWGKNDFAFNVPVTITKGGLTIGETSINEAQLKKILELIEQV